MRNHRADSCASQLQRFCDGFDEAIHCQPVAILLLGQVADERGPVIAGDDHGHTRHVHGLRVTIRGAAPQLNVSVRALEQLVLLQPHAGRALVEENFSVKEWAERTQIGFGAGRTIHVEDGGRVSE